MESLSEICKQLGDLGYAFDRFAPKDEASLYEIFREVVETGKQFPYESSSREEFQRQFLNPQGKVYVCRSAAQEVVGGFYIRANYSGRAEHIANAAYMIRSQSRGQGIGTLLVKASLQIAKELGFKTMQYNMVFSQNEGAVRLYQRLGFSIVGILPDAIRNPDSSYQDGYVMSRSIN